MDTVKKIAEDGSPHRRKFVFGVGVLSVLAAVSATFGLPFFNKKKVLSSKAEKKTVKMLTEDGRLVEIDGALLTAARKKVTNAELQNWIKK